MQANHRKNLIKLADWLEAHTQQGERDIVLEDGRHVTFDIEIYSNTYDETTCGSAGCAIGWATRAIEPRQPLESGNSYVREGNFESWHKYATRLFGYGNFDDGEGTFMFCGDWYLWPEQNTVRETVKRIRYVVEHDTSPDEWEGWDCENQRVSPNTGDGDE